MADFYKVVYQDGENIFEAGANAGNLYILMDGCVELVGAFAGHLIDTGILRADVGRLALVRHRSTGYRHRTD